MNELKEKIHFDLIEFQHGTCPTCRVTLDGENSTRRDYSSYSSNTNSSTRNNQRRHDDDNPGSHSNLMDFD